ncbi:MAG TPA: AarF/UbiB family protein [Longimicrobiales bacterium]|nr:AarF/UbiB family protein [Longimicrobiales bacterium]
MRRLARSWSVFVRLSPYLLAFLRDRKRWVLVGRPAKRRAGHHQKRATRLVATIAGLGPTFIKLAQLLSARADILPEPYLTEISTLQDQVPPDPVERILEVVEAELGKPVSEAFDDFDREPVAAASLGQVHDALVDGREVVVKVLRPDVEETVALDLDISFRLLFWLNILFPNHHVQALTNVVREFSHKVREEMDFRKEAEHIHHFRETFRAEPGVRAPEVLDRFTRRRVLVMERVDGTKIDRLQEHFDSGRLTFSRVMENLTGVYLRMMMVDGFLHADPHPGNLLVQDDGTIVLIDWGMVMEIPRWTREAILDVALAVGNENLEGIINGMYQLGMIRPEVSRGEIREAALEVMRIVERARTTSRERVQELVEQIFDTFYTWPLMLPEELVYFFRAAALLEGIGFRYDPTFNGLHFIRGVIRRYSGEIARATGKEPVAMAKNVIDEAQTTLRSLRELVGRAEREELRVRVHPRDMSTQERFLHLQARRLLLSIFATATAVITSILFIPIRSWWLLAAGFAASLLMFVLVFFIPTHLLENPLRHARRIRPGQDRG